MKLVDTFNFLLAILKDLIRIAFIIFVLIFFAYMYNKVEVDSIFSTSVLEKKNHDLTQYENKDNEKKLNDLTELYNSRQLNDLKKSNNGIITINLLSLLLNHHINGYLSFYEEV